MDEPRTDLAHADASRGVESELFTDNGADPLSARSRSPRTTDRGDEGADVGLDEADENADEDDEDEEDEDEDEDLD